jgi:hypothetical protein
MINSNDPLNAFTIPEIVTNLEHRGFGSLHTVDIEELSWVLEHPLRCRLMQLDETFNIMYTLRESCATNQALESGLADSILEERGTGRYLLDGNVIKAEAI